jgi:hypothetical protein
MNILVKMKFGSHMYGTNVATSDTDYKAIYIPSADDILMQRARKVIHENTNKTNTKNSNKDVDTEYISIQRYMELLLEGQTMALDMLFAPDDMILEGGDRKLWDYIRNNKKEFLHSGVLSFVGYCRTQANKYGIKGSRMSAIKEALGLFNLVVNGTNRLEDINYTDLLENDHIKMVDCKGPNNKTEPHLEICNRKFGMRTKVENIIFTLEKIYDGYGHRAKLAEKNEGIDWKALMHAVRIQYQAKELLSTGHITFPRPEKDLLLDIRNGKLDYKVVARIIEDGLDELEQMESNLPKKPNKEFADKLVCDVHHSEIQKRGSL